MNKNKDSQLPFEWDETEEEATPDGYPAIWDVQTGDKESREGLQTVNPNAQIFNFGLKVNTETWTNRMQAQADMKGQFQDLISTYLTSKYPGGEQFDVAEVVQAFRDALDDEASWYQEQSTRCAQFRELIKE
jgi:hypothetical protein